MPEVHLIAELTPSRQLSHLSASMNNSYLDENGEVMANKRENNMQNSRVP